MSSSQRSKRALEKQKTLNREWLIRPGACKLLDLDVAYILSNLQSNESGTRLNIADAVWRLGVHYSVSGQVALIEGGNDGWTDILRGWRYTVSALQIRISAFQNSRVLGGFRPIQHLNLEVGRCALCLAYAISLGRVVECQKLRSQLKWMLSDPSVVTKDYWVDHCLEPFILKLSDTFLEPTQGLPVMAGFDLGVYDTVISSWTDPSRLADGLLRACDYHCAQLGGGAADLYSPFRYPPFDLVPAEIYAVFGVRAVQDLGMPQIDHPLVRPPFHAPPRPTDIPRDPLLAQLDTLSSSGM